MNRFDAIVSADAFENLKPAPDIFLAASKTLDVPTNEVCFYNCRSWWLLLLVLIFIYLFGYWCCPFVVILSLYWALLKACLSDLS